MVRVHPTHVSLGRAVRTAYRGTTGDALYIIAQGEVSCVQQQQRDHPVQSRPARAALLERLSRAPAPQCPSVPVLHPARLHRGALSGRPKSTPSPEQPGVPGADRCTQPPRMATSLVALGLPESAPPGAAASLAPRGGLSAAIRAQAPISHTHPQARSRRARAQEWLLADEAAVRVHLDRGGSSQSARPPSRS